jgi:TnpA family transposase
LSNKDGDLSLLFKNHNFVKFYINLKENRSEIIKDHKYNKSGIYLLYNRINGHYYVGSSKNIANRMKNYLNISNLEQKKNSNMPIVKALLKYGHINFSLFIIEYLSDKDLAKRETF